MAEYTLNMNGEGMKRPPVATFRERFLELGNPSASSRYLFTVYALYTGMALLITMLLFAHSSGEVPWPMVVLLGVLAWIADSQGLTVLKTSILTLELCVYLWAFLCIGFIGAWSALVIGCFLVILQGMITSRSNLRLEFILQKLGNVFVLGISLAAGCLAYTLITGGHSFTELNRTTGFGLLSFWLVFVIVNSVVFLPYEMADEGPLFPRVLREALIDGFLQGIAVLAGAGFALIYLLRGAGGIVLLVPVVAILVRVLKRLTLQGQNLEDHITLMHDLNTISARLHQSLDLKLVLDAVGKICNDLFNADTYFVALLDERTSRVRFVRVMEEGKEIRHEDVDMEQGLTGRVLRTGKPLFSRNLQEDRTLRPRILRAGDPDNPVHSVMVAPLMDKDRPIGVFSVQSHHPKAFRPFQEELFLSVNHQVAAAILAARLYKRATEDSLTRLYNKSFFEERLRKSLDRGDPFGLLFLDCDDFKSINDRFGHVTGDHYLQKLGSLLAHESRTDDVPCRYGGDEFAVLLPQATRQQTLRAAERIRKKVLHMPFRVDGQPAGTSVSIGALWSRGSGSSLPVQDILKRIDDSLYKAKERKNVVELTTL